MKTWAERPQEIAHLLNPAFTSLALMAAIQGHIKEGEVGMPFPLIFLILPIALHEPTLEALPNRITSSMPAWLQENPEAMTNLSERARSFRQFTQEALRFLCARQMAIIADSARLEPGAASSPTAHRQKTAIGESEFLIMTGSAFLGRWFARSGDLTTIMTLWGVRP
jgi:hypothetical protein